MTREERIDILREQIATIERLQMEAMANQSWDTEIEALRKKVRGLGREPAA